MNKLLIFICLVLAVLCFVLFKGGKAVVRDDGKLREQLVECETERVWRGGEIRRLNDYIAEISEVVEKCKAERDRLRAELKTAAEALGAEEAEEVVELGVFRGRLQHVEQELERARAERDKVLGELLDCKAERDAAVEEFVRVLGRCEKLEAVIEAKDDALQRLGGDVNCLREELEKAQGCVKCHQNHSKHRRHR